MNLSAALINYEELYQKLKKQFASETFGFYTLCSELPDCVQGNPWQVINILKDLGLIEIVYIGPHGTKTTPMSIDEFRML